MHKIWFQLASRLKSILQVRQNKAQEAFLTCLSAAALEINPALPSFHTFPQYDSRPSAMNWNICRRTEDLAARCVKDACSHPGCPWPSATPGGMLAPGLLPRKLQVDTSPEQETLHLHFLTKYLKDQERNAGFGLARCQRFCQGMGCDQKWPADLARTPFTVLASHRTGPISDWI